MKWIMSIFHDNPTKVYQNADMMYQQILKIGNKDHRHLPITREGNRYIVIIIDYFTRWLEARVIKVANAETVATFIYEKIICQFGLPKVLQSDCEIHFVNKVIQKLIKRFKIRYSLSSLYYLQSNGLVEKFNKTLC